jgi:hypothetical protein
MKGIEGLEEVGVATVCYFVEESVLGQEVGVATVYYFVVESVLVEAAMVFE